MRITLATPLYPPEPGGPATYAELLARELPSRGIEVDVVKFADVRGYPKLLRHYLYYLRVYRSARGSDAVLALDPVSTGVPALSAAKRAKKPFLVKVVGDYAWEQGVQRFGIEGSLDEFLARTDLPLPVRLLKNLETRVARQAVRTIVPSEYLANVVASWGIAREKIVVIGNSVDVSIRGAVPEHVAELPRPLVATVGRLVPWKRMNKVIDAVATLRDFGVEASLTIIGDGPLLAPLREQANEELPGASTLPGRLSHEDVLATIEAADVFVLNSTYEGLSHLLIEALRLGKPVIATDAGGNGEVIKNETNGLLISVEDDEALPKALERLLTDEALRAKLSAGALSAGEAYAPEKVADATAKLLTETL